MSILISKTYVNGGIPCVATPVGVLRFIIITFYSSRISVTESARVTVPCRTPPPRMQRTSRPSSRPNASLIATRVARPDKTSPVKSIHQQECANVQYVPGTHPNREPEYLYSERHETFFFSVCRRTNISFSILHTGTSLIASTTGSAIECRRLSHCRLRPRPTLHHQRMKATLCLSVTQPIYRFWILWDSRVTRFVTTQMGSCLAYE